MSRENVEVVRQIFEAQDRGEIDAINAAYAPDIEWEDFVWQGWGTVRGIDELRQMWRRWAEVFGRARFEATDFLDAGEDVVISLKVRGRTRGTQLDLQQHLGMVWTVRSGKVVRARVYRDRAEALEAVGPRE